MSQDIYIVDKDNSLTTEITQMVSKNNKYKFKCMEPKQIENLIKDIPELIIIHEDNIDEKTEEICKTIRNSEDNNITPIIVFSSDEEKEHKLRIVKNYAEYFIEKSMGTDYLLFVINNILRILSVNRTVSPLTGLPGNVQIQSELKKRLIKKTNFAVLYLDLDNFKAYNDVYGFLKGDEIIKLTAQIIVKFIHTIEGVDTFVGHIGGDDFVALIDGEINLDEICQSIIAEFDVEVKKHFTEEDAERGFLKVQNRRGIIEEFPLTSLSIGVVVCDKNRFANILEIGEVGAQVKHLAKSTVGSCYAVNRRERNK